MATPTHDSRQTPNRLAGTSSPYLLQHAFNPVDWHPWGEEAIALARTRDVPIFLSIGYSTCYWCHVMERESFEHQPTAALMNEHFVCIKLDREQRPDLDELYMAATVAMTGHGGWPMSVFLEPDTLRPFFCGTYYPRDAVYAGRPTFRQVLDGLREAYATRRDEVRSQAQALAQAVAEQAAAQPAVVGLGADEVSRAVSRLLNMFDATHGGFGLAPKFPQPVFLEFLLDVRTRVDEQSRGAIDRAVRHTLDKMALGGLHDQLGGGFHRYCVDATWTVPHFEKMLYDNAQLLRVYARAARTYGDSFYAHVALRTAACVARDLTGPQGEPFSALDAEVSGREGLNYLWTPAQVHQALGERGMGGDVDLACAVLAIGTEPHEQPNFRDPHHPADPGAWVPTLRQRPQAWADALGMPADAFAQRWERVQAALLDARSARPQPHRDDKTIAAWAGLCVGALADASVLLEQPELLAQARRSADACLAMLLAPDGTLLRDARGQARSCAGFLEDSAAMSAGLTALCSACARAGDAAGAARYGDAAVALAQRAQADFFDKTADLLFDTRADQPDLFVRACSTHDGALPSGFSMMLHAWLDLAEVLGPKRGEAFIVLARRALIARSGSIAHSPVGCVNSTRALLRMLTLGAEVASQLASAGPPAPREGADDAGPAHAPDDAVQIYAGADRVTIAQGQPAGVALVVHVADGYHVIGATQDDDTDAALVPFRVDVMNGAGLRAYADYPAGEVLASHVPGLERVRVYRGTFELAVVLEREGEWQGTPLLCVRFQVCRDDACFRPTTVELDISLDRA